MQEMRCNICNSQEFLTGPGKRLSMTGKLPTCAHCGSLERHRALRLAYDKLPDSWLNESRALQFSDDHSVPRRSFKSLEISVYEKQNSLDIQNIDRESESYDWVVSNHVLEHVPNDALAMTELLRVLRPEGVLQFSVPGVLVRKHCIDWGFADEKRHGHFREYGRDIFNRFDGCFAGGWSVYSRNTHDPVTGVEDIFFFVVKSEGKKQYFGEQDCYQQKI
jgi:SAM-dependent methyltransferase